jgi:hypothetical protein
MILSVEKNAKIDDGYMRQSLYYLLLRTRLNYGYTEIAHYLVKCRCFGVKRHGDALDKR